MILITRVRRPLVLAALTLIGACADNIPVGVNQQPQLTTTGRLASVNAEDVVAGQIVVRFRPGAPRSEIAQTHRAHKKGDLMLARTEVLEVPVGEEREIAAQLNTNPNVEFAEPDWIMRVGPCETTATCDLPDGSLWAFKWDLYNTGSFVDPVFGGGTILTGKPDADIDWGDLYDYLGANFQGSAVIGILDTGIRPTHAMFLNKLSASKRFLSDSTTAGKTNVADDNGHGSHVAGLAAGRATAAVPGVAYSVNVKLLIGKVCDAAGACPNSSVANGIHWAADNGANVINLSLGTFGGNPDGSGSPLLQAELQYAAGKNVLPVCSAGNDDGKSGYSGGISYPARFPECMAVGATNWSDTKATYSNYSVPCTSSLVCSKLEISAPGGDMESLPRPYSLILSAGRASDGNYVFTAGTSAAAPEVAGAAALLFATGMTDANAVRQRLISTADDIETPGWDPRTGAGRLNVYRAVTGVDPNAPPVSIPGGNYTGHKGVAVQFDGSASFDPNQKPVTLAWNFGDPNSSDNTSTLVKPTHTYMRAGTYTVSLGVTDAANLMTTATTTAIIPNIVPVVTFDGSTILQGETFAMSGAFTDADPDAWSATVNYGDDSPTQSLALSSAKTFGLGHQYMASGAQTVTVTVSDDDGGMGIGRATVTVWTPQQGIQALLLDVLAASDLPHGTVNSLSAKLRAAQASLDRGRDNTAENQLNAFGNELDAVAKTGRMSPILAAQLTASADRIHASINR